MPHDAPYTSIRSPLRICPLGAHVDHQGGLVTALTIDEHIELRFRPRPDGTVRMRSTRFPGIEEFAIDAVPDPVPGWWGTYLRGAVRSLKRTYPLRTGFEGVVDARLPSGGLSSSAALCTAFVRAAALVNEIEFNEMELIHAAHWIERECIGLNNGILDYAANVLCREGKLLYLDCATEAHQLVPPGPMPPFTVLLVWSGVEQALVSTGYNRRVEECRQAAARLVELGATTQRAELEAPAGSGGNVWAGSSVRLGDIPPGEARRLLPLLPGPLRRRARHYYDEVERVEAGVEAWRRGDLRAFGALMNESGRSSIENYECGSPPLATLYEILVDLPGVYGTRFAGGGYRGFCFALIDPDARELVESRVCSEYARRHPEYAAAVRAYPCRTAGAVAVAR